LKNLNNTTFSQNKSKNQVRINGGSLRGQKIIFSNTSGLRPTGNRIKETLFNWIGQHVENSNCLDLFSGSGSLGIESISHGAKSVTMIEKNHFAFLAIKNSCARLNIKNVTIIEADAIKWISEESNGATFDLVFLDPPFMSDLVPVCCNILEKNKLLSSPCYIYVETSKKQKGLCVPENWILLKDKVTGQVAYKLYLRN
jgi:16S rRNA (guanine966-N2)-methyltransferase